jgi:VIT1/CCC1 family predicted Fe2+/Mn2+ transporter
MPNRSHPERHRNQHIGWLRAAVLGANDGIVSTASLLVGIAAANTGKEQILVAGVAALVAGAMAMAAGEYLSVSSQADTEAADLSKERLELANAPDRELRELTAIYVARGVEPATATDVARQLMAHDALGAHARDELGLSSAVGARPVQAAVASAASFAVGAALPLAVALLVPERSVLVGVAGMSLLFLAALGVLSARAGGAPVARATARVVARGALAMGATAGVGALFGGVV